MQSNESVRSSCMEAESPEPDGLSIRPYRLDAYERLWDRLLTHLNEGDLDEYTQAMVELGLLLAAGLYRIERAVAMAASPEALDDSLDDVLGAA